MRVTLCHLSTWNGAEHMGLSGKVRAPLAAVTFPLLINSVKRTKVTRVGFRTHACSADYDLNGNVLDHSTISPQGARSGAGGVAHFPRMQ